MEEKREWISEATSLLLMGILLFVIYLTRIYSFILFHAIAELLSIAVAGAIFAVGWNARKSGLSTYFAIIGIAFLFIGGIDLLHTLAYKGMGVFNTESSNFATQLWIAARYYQAGAFLTATLSINKQVKPLAVMLVDFLAFLGVLLSIFIFDIFPVCYLEGSGLTPFKIVSEYIIDLVLCISLVLMWLHRKEFDKRVFWLVVSSIIATIGSELAFTFYIGVYDFSNVIGHLLKIIAVFFIYRAIVVTGISQPLDSLLLKLQKNEIELEEKAISLENSRDELQHLVKHIPEGILVLNRDGSMRLANQSFREHYETIVRTPFPKDFNVKISIVNDNTFLQTLQTIYEMMENTQMGIEPIPDKLWMLVIASLINQKGSSEPQALLIETRDISSFIQFENLQRQFLETVSHEMNTPLTAIDLSIGNLHKFGSNLAPSHHEKLLKTLIENSNVLKEMIRDILDVSRLDAHSVVINPGSFNVRDLIEEVMLQLEAKREMKNIDFQLEVATDLQAYGDRTRIGQVLRNLVDNAIKFSSVNQSVKITAKSCPRSYDGQSLLGDESEQGGVVIAVTDHGQGISQKDFPQLFTKFFRTPEARNIPGTGLGLTIAKEIVELHGGTIWVTSELGEGSTFTFFLPSFQEDTGLGEVA